MCPASDPATASHRDTGHNRAADTVRARRDRRRTSILRGAADAFAKTGYAATSMETIAEHAGVSKLIVYRHFDSKEDLYRAVLEQVAGRLAEEFVDATSRREGSAVPARAFLAVAREDPDGFRLLWRHSAREPQFAEYADRFRSLAVSFARSVLAPRVRDASLHEWAGETAVAVLVEAVLNWLAHGDESRDEEFVDLATRSLVALVGAWA